jgi:hypothetical protein
MDVTWVILKKNKEIYKYKLLDNEFLFDIKIMNLQIEGWNTEVKMNYDDIICIRTEDYFKETIRKLPQSLEEFHMKNSHLKEIPPFNKNIKNVQIINSRIVFNEKEAEEFKQLYPGARVNIATYDYMKKDYITTRPVFERHNDPRNINININRMFDFDDAVRNGTTHHALKDNSQTVHISSINNCVIKAIEIIKEESKKYTELQKPANKLFELPLKVGSPYYYKWFLNIVNPVINQFKEISLKMALLQWMEDESRHTVHEFTFKELFTMIMTIVENHEQKENMKERIITELRDSIGLCFTGRINRMVNALVGFVDGIMIGLSEKEEIQMKISIIIKQLMDKKINKETAKEKMTEMFSHVGEKENISDNYKQANLSALDDYDDDVFGRTMET